MSTAEHSAVEHNQDEAASETQHPEIEASVARGIRFMSWVNCHRRESAAAVIAGIMATLIFASTPSHPTADQAPKPNLDSISELFAELDSAATVPESAAAINRPEESASGITHQHNASWSNPIPPPPLQIPLPDGVTPDRVQTPVGLTSEKAPQDGTRPGRIRFSGMLRPAK
jgi:hypothetical protein